MNRPISRMRHIFFLLWSVVTALLIVLSACGPAPTNLETCNDDYVIVDGNGFECKTSGNSYKLIGVNIRGLAYIDQRGFSADETYRVDLSGNDPGIIQRQIETAAQMGVKVIRIYAPYYNLNKNQIFDAIDRILAISQLLETQERIHEIKYLIAFTDFYYDIGSFAIYAPDCPGFNYANPKESDLSTPQCYYKFDDPAAKNQIFLEPDWFENDYKTKVGPDNLSYREFVEELVQHYISPKNINLASAGITPPSGQTFPSGTVTITPQQIFAWGLGNEFQVNYNNEPVTGNALVTLQSFIQDIGCLIHTIDSEHMVTSGFISTFHATLGASSNPEDLYIDPAVTCSGGRKALDFGTIHGYDNAWSHPRSKATTIYFDDQLEQSADYMWFKDNIPYIVEELGFDGATDGSTSTPPEPQCGNGKPYFAGDNWGDDTSTLTGTNLPSGLADRGPATGVTLDAFFNTLDADGVLQWAFTAGVAPVEDGCRGMSNRQAFTENDPNNKNGSLDWSGLYSAYCEMAEDLDELATDSLQCAANARSSKVDVVVVMDTTGSMVPGIAAAKSVAINYIDQLADSGVDYRAAVVDYKDKRYDPYASRLDLAFTKDRTAISNAINALSATGGGDTPEDVYSGLMTAINLPWRDGSKKVIILMGDAGPLDPEPGTGYTLRSVINAANAVDPASIYAIRIGNNTSMRSAFQQLANGTGGMTFDASNTTSSVSTAILNALNSVAHAPSAVIGENNGQIVGSIGTPIHFDASHSFDVDGFIVQYDWDFNNDGLFDLNSPDPTADYTYTQAYNGWVTLRVHDNDGNTNKVSVKIMVDATGNDTTPPVINITSPLPQAYLHTDSVNVSWTATDTGSGIASSTGALDSTAVTNGQTFDLFFLSLGSHTLLVTATDNAGNTATASVTFTIVADIDSLIAMEQWACSLGWIDGDGVCNSLEAKLLAAKASIDRGRFNTARNQLNAFIAELDAQKDKKVTQGYDILKADAIYVVNNLP